MQLPEHLHRFPHATLIVSADSLHARLYLIGGDQMEELDGITMPREELSDREGTFEAPQDLDDSSRLNHFLKTVSEQIAALVRQHEIKEIDLVMSAELEHHLTEMLSHDVKPLVHKRIHADVMKESALELVERVTNA